MRNIAVFDHLSLEEMQLFAGQLAKILRPLDWIALYGDLGTGKSTFCRALLRAMGVAEDIPSPTFTIVQHYDLPTASIWHCDLYRIQSPHEIMELGLAEQDNPAIKLIEWPERMGNFLPELTLRITLGFTEHDETRKLTLQGSAPWITRLQPILHD